jgi:hypothetical protein
MSKERRRRGKNEDDEKNGVTGDCTLVKSRMPSSSMACARKASFAMSCVATAWAVSRSHPRSYYGKSLKEKKMKRK